jgi:hypothetical protein
MGQISVDRDCPAASSPYVPPHKAQVLNQWPVTMREVLSA